MKPIIITLTTFLLTALLTPLTAADMSRYNVVWHTPSRDATGVMPLGNGDIAAGVYAIENGDLYLLLAKNDAYTYMGDIFKTGRVRVSLSPNPFLSGKPFRQTLDLPSGSIRIEADGVGLRIWADAHRPVYHIEIESPRDLAVSVQPEFWTRFDGCAFNILKPENTPGARPVETGQVQDVCLDRAREVQTDPDPPGHQERRGVAVGLRL